MLLKIKRKQIIALLYHKLPNRVFALIILDTIMNKKLGENTVLKSVVGNICSYTDDK